MKRLLLSLVGLAILAVILVRIDLSAVLEEVKAANVNYLVLAAFLIVVVALIKSWRWRFLLGILGVHYSIKQATMIYFSGLFLGIATPGKIGEFSKALYVSGDTKAGLSTGLISALTDRLFDLYALLIVGGVGLALLLHEATIMAILPILLLPVLLIRSGRIARFLKERTSKIHGAYIEIRKLVSTRPAVPILTTIVVYVVFFLHAWSISLALSLPIPFLTIVGFVAIASLVEIVPITLAGFGTRDAALIALFSTQNLSAELAVSYALLMFLTGHLVIIALGGISWQLKPLRLLGK